MAADVPIPTAMPAPVTIPDASGCLETLARRGKRVALVATGGGTAAIPGLVALPGASRVVVEALVPYARPAVDALLGGAQESYCSTRAARRLAMAAWERARAAAGPEAAVGIACTASLATLDPKRGEHRVFVAVQTLGETSMAALLLAKDARSRAEEETIAAALVVDRLAAAAGEGPGTPRTDRLLGDGERVAVERTAAEPGWAAVLGGSLPRTRLAGPPADAAPEAIFPGSFDPLHDGHRAMQRIASRITGLPVAYELSLSNVDKPALDHAEIARRAAGLAGQRAWLTAAPTFVDKLAIFPGAVFVMGADTFVRLWNPRYYGDCADRAAEAVARIGRGASRLVVFGRVRDGVFLDPAGLAAPEALRAIATFVPEAEFRDDVSSTALRRAAEPPAET